MFALIFYGREVSSRVFVLQRRIHSHHRWMFSQVVLEGLNESMSAIYKLDTPYSKVADTRNNLGSNTCK